jgi:hypothetical protein
MKRRSLRMLACALVAAATVRCGERHASRHEAPAAITVVEPTPDTTPVESLRTPAGLALKPEPVTTPASSATAAPPTPSAKGSP